MNLLYNNQPPKTQKRHYINKKTKQEKLLITLRKKKYKPNILF